MEIQNYPRMLPTMQSLVPLWQEALLPIYHFSPSYLTEMQIQTAGSSHLQMVPEQV